MFVLECVFENTTSKTIKFFYFENKSGFRLSEYAKPYNDVSRFTTSLLMKVQLSYGAS